MTSEEEGLPRKRRRRCPRTPYVLNEKSLVYGCDCCMPPKDVCWFAWMCAGKRLGLPRDVARLIGGMLEKPWAEWKTWYPRGEVSMTIPLTQTSILSRFCCDAYDNCVPFSMMNRTFRTCYCNPTSWEWLTRLSLGGDVKDSRLSIYVSGEYRTVEIINNK